MMAQSPPVRPRTRGFTLIELVLVILILGILAGLALPAYVSMRKEAETSSAENVTGSLKSALGIKSSKQLLAGQVIAAHNPFDDLVIVPNNYAGAFGDVDLSNCQPGQWAYQIGNGANGFWPIVIYRPMSTLTTAFSWGGSQWILYEVKTVTSPAGNVVQTYMAEYPPLHKW